MRTIYKGRRVWGSLLLLFTALTVSAQSVVRGKVTDDRNEALVGVSVMVRGTNAGSVSDDRGNYSVSVPAGVSEPVLVFSLIGYARKEVTVGAQSLIDVRLEEENTHLSEVVVVGYGTQKVGDVTS